MHPNNIDREKDGKKKKHSSESNEKRQKWDRFWLVEKEKKKRTKIHIEFCTFPCAYGLYLDPFYLSIYLSGLNK